MVLAYEDEEEANQNEMTPPGMDTNVLVTDWAQSAKRNVNQVAREIFQKNLIANGLQLELEPREVYSSA